MPGIDRSVTTTSMPSSEVSACAPELAQTTR